MSTYTLFLLCAALALGPAMAGAAEKARPLIYGSGITWGRWLGLPAEEAKAFDRRSMDRIKEMAKPEYHMVFQASYLVLTDLPEANDATGHDFGLCARDRRAGTITPRSSYEAFRDLSKAWKAAK